MHFEIKDELAVKFKKALEISKEDETKVIERMFKTYTYDVLSRKVETFEGVESFMKLPKHDK